ncbi:peroxiredoxin, Ohr subfamily [Flavobacterium sp. CF108]|jgi:Ohr subfamily peroxiredoxin|uniref:Ohr family peroxiredoxin n=1 Tax=unclassified Flavobacterium TaxID=196869 RepID=UPI0008ADDD6F|nr:MULTISPECIES: Ohr family peroxiredoxin [unclassified Flavobacterium]SEO16879.1 peroxiredoxin, Ohr subfamily [Flavobacterium sp. fv08]SHG56210.1 peroxiredoxin, Ohr subfamily [Flavobacterium sp. CF108]
MENSIQQGKVVYSGSTVTTGGREGFSKSSDGRLDIKLTSPGAKGEGTNPEQLLAAGWSACFLGAMSKSAASLNLKLPADSSIHTEIDLVLSETEGYTLQARLNITLPGIERETAKAIAEASHLICPYSKALTGGIKVETNIL